MKSIKKILVIMVMVLMVISSYNIVEAKSLTKISAKSATLTVGKSKTLSVKKNGKKVKTAKWSSSKKAVATVSKTGKVIAKKAGKAVIKAKVNGKTYKCTVTVKASSKKNANTEHTHNWVYKVDKKAYDEKKTVTTDEWVSIWTDKEHYGELTPFPNSCTERMLWCEQHCTNCWDNVPDPDPFGRCAFQDSANSTVHYEIVHHDEVGHYECSVCGVHQ